MKISELIKKLEEIKSENGDINVVVSERDNYWGSVETHITKYNMLVSENAQPDGPKSGKTEKAVIFSYS